MNDQFEAFAPTVEQSARSWQKMVDYLIKAAISFSPIEADPEPQPVA